MISKHEDRLTVGREKNAFQKFDRFIQANIEKGKNSVKNFINSSKKSFGPDGKNKVKKRPFSYFETFMKDPEVAAIHPSSKFVVNRVIRAMNMHNVRSVIEFGAAEGVITHKMLKNLHPEGLLLAIEKNAKFYRSLSGIHDGRLKPVHGDVRDFRRIMHDSGIKNVDCIVSGIPFSFMTQQERNLLIADVHSCLSHGGRFVAYQFTTHLIPLMRRHFRKMHVEFEIRNIPPHFILTGVKE